jgi:adenylate cyclase
VRDHVHGRLDLAFEELGALSLKNIARPFEAFVLRPNAVISKSVGRSLVYGTGEALPLPDKPSIAVLAFNNMSGDAEQEYFSDGISEDIIAELSRSHSLFVIARNSSFTYKGRAVDVRQVGRELGVRYVLEGSVRRSGSRIRVVAQLIEAETGSHIWAERCDRALEDIFAVQDEITSAVVTAIVPAVADAEVQRILRKPPENLGAWEAYQRGLWHLGKSNAANNMQAIEFLKRAIELDASFVPAYSALGLASIYQAGAFRTRTVDEIAKHAESWARMAVGIDATDADAQAILSHVTVLAGNLEDALRRARLARNSSPSSSVAFASEGFVLVHMGLRSQGRDALREALRLDPHGPANAVIMNHLVMAYYLDGAYNDAIEAARQAIMRYPDWPLTHRWLAAALGQAERAEEASAALQIAMSSEAFELYTRKCPPWSNPADFEHLLEGLRKAGWQG